MTRLVLIRHGQSEANRVSGFTGQSHIPLSDLGWRQAQKTAEYVAENYRIDTIYSSDLLRAYETGVALSEKLGIMKIHTHPGLREIFAGEWEGLPFAEIPEKYPEDFRKWKEHIEYCKCTGGESVAEMHERVLGAVLQIAKENDGKTVALTFHSTPIRALAAYIRDASINNMEEIPWPSNASVSVVEVVNQKITMPVYAYDDHLAGIQ